MMASNMAAGRWLLQISQLAGDRLQHRADQRGAKLLDVPHGDGVDDGLLVGEEAIERADRQPGFGGDARGGYVLQRHLLQQGTGGVEDAVDGSLAAVLNGLAAPRDFSSFLQTDWFRIVCHGTPNETLRTRSIAIPELLYLLVDFLNFPPLQRRELRFKPT